MDFKYVRSRWTLGWALLKHLALRWVVRRSDPQVWLARIKRELLTPTPSDAWNYQAEASRCIGCGLCELLSGPDTPAASWSVAWPASSLVADARQPSDALLVLDKATLLQAQAQEIARLCPAQVHAEIIAHRIIQNARGLLGP